jgi:hypothetical protein
MENLIGAIQGAQPGGAAAAAASFPFPSAARDGPSVMASLGLDGTKCGPSPATVLGDVKGSPTIATRGGGGLDQGVRLLGAGKKEEEEEEEEAAPLDIDDLFEEPLCEKVKGLGTFYILIDKHSRKRKRGFTGLRRSQKAAIVR